MMRALYTALLTLFCSGAAFADTPDYPAVTLDGTEQWLMHNAAGTPYRIMVSLPEGDLPWTGVRSVLYVLDANAYFPGFHAAKRGQKAFRQSIIIGIAYPGSDPLNFLRRSYDFSPPAPAGLNEPPQGGQDELLDFIEQQLMPAVAERFSIDPHQQSLFGHSFGGMFALYTLFTRPSLFDHLVAASPSQWWSDRFLLQHERDFTQQVQAQPGLVTHSSLALISAERDAAATREDARALAARLQPLSIHGLRVSEQVIDGEDHMSLPYRIPSLVLEQVFSNRRR
ncbi:MAG TPA: esterase [Pseudomonas sp.]|nr:esterase [Pseudomonadales bacterium]MAQ52598.1 esterase [Pseudomonas sp.]MBB51693.1 esterase [Pseudomonadales bacterium]MBF78290.1 esterase [Pseudomonadales bacterium]MBU30112.1 esterase [Pseudomonadales bacterium]|tara:strand:+ start:630 stop:1478 length:849 start_codon:yes stop_codon:yes gene_type:complete